jgi:hypothetical protein
MENRKERKKQCRKVRK